VVSLFPAKDHNSSKLEFRINVQLVVMADSAVGYEVIGIDDGTVVGFNVEGYTVGCEVGSDEGVNVGLEVGLELGLRVGSKVGLEVGFIVVASNSVVSKSGNSVLPNSGNSVLPKSQSPVVVKCANVGGVVGCAVG